MGSAVLFPDLSIEAVTDYDAFRALHSGVPEAKEAGMGHPAGSGTGPLHRRALAGTAGR